MQMVMTVLLMARSMLGSPIDGEQVGALGEVVVADDDRGVGADRLVDGGDAAAGARVVDEVVVHQRGGVDELDAHGQVEGVVAVGVAERGAEQDQRRPQPLAAGADDVLHGVGHRAEVGLRPTPRGGARTR